MSSSKPKIAIFHAFFKSDCKGGGEKLILQMRKHYNADLFTGAIGMDGWGKHLVGTDNFAREVWDPTSKFTYLHEESKIPIWRKIKRQLFFLFSPKVKELDNYDIIIFSGNVSYVPDRVSKHVKKIMYCHTTPRPFTDQFQALLDSKPTWMHPLIKLFQKWVILQYREDCKKMDVIITNSENIKNRLYEYIGIEADKVIFPAVNTNRFKYLGQSDYYLSYTRLEPLKRTKLIVEAFAKMPDKKLVVASSGPLAGWVKEQIETRNLKNITYKGIVSDEKLADLVGNCVAGIMIPVNEDAGITQVEIMAAGKPVIGVNEGGLIETVVDGKSGVLIKANPDEQDLIKAVEEMTPEKAIAMKDFCTEHAKQFDSSVFFEKMDKVIGEVGK